MEICSHCKMYMKPIINREKGEASCEFCGNVIAVLKKGKIIQTPPNHPPQ